MSVRNVLVLNMKNDAAASPERMAPITTMYNRVLEYSPVDNKRPPYLRRSQIWGREHYSNGDTYQKLNAIESNERDCVRASQNIVQVNDLINFRSIPANLAVYFSKITRSMANDATVRIADIASPASAALSENRCEVASSSRNSRRILR